MKIHNIMKKSLICLVITAVMFSVAGCGGQKSEVKEAEKTEAAEQTVEVDGVKIDYKTSELYSKEDMDAAITEIMKEFDSWEGCEMHEISYTDDQMCKDNLSYVGELDTDKEFEDCIVFTSSFHSPKEGGGAWEADYEYEGWQWYLAREKGGSWELLTWGY